MRKLLIKFIELTKDQRNLTANDLKDTYIRPYENRFEFKCEKVFLPNTIPFEIFCFYRHFHLAAYEGLDLQNFFSDNFFSFEGEFIFQQVKIDDYNLRYVMLQPITSACFRMFLRKVRGDSWDFVPMVHPLGYR